MQFRIYLKFLHVIKTRDRGLALQSPTFLIMLYLYYKNIITFHIPVLPCQYLLDLRIGTDILIESGLFAISGSCIATDISIVSVLLLGCSLVSTYYQSYKDLYMGKQIAIVIQSEVEELHTEIYSLTIYLENKISGLENTIGGLYNKIGILERIVYKINSTLHRLYKQTEEPNAPLIHERKVITKSSVFCYDKVYL